MRAGVVAPAFLFAFFTDFKFPRIKALGRWVNREKDIKNKAFDKCIEFGEKSAEKFG